MSRPLPLDSRRRFLSTLTVGAFSCASIAPAAETTDDFAFYVIGDTHYLADHERPAQMDAKSADVCGRLVDTLNRLPGEAIPEAAGGGKVRTPAGVIHAGDVIDTGDKAAPTARAMQMTEWSAFRDDYGLTGRDGRLKFPVYELAGNHDSPHGEGHAIEQMKRRNPSRPGVVYVSDNGVQYSWDWGGTHFVNLGLIVGTDPAVTRKRRYAALDSLAFLVRDLEKHVGDSGRPVVLTHHVDIARYTGLCDPEAAPGSKEWDACDVLAFHAAIRRYRVAGIFYGHTHSRAALRWDGESTKGTEGIPVFNTDNASHFGGDAQAFFYVESRAGRLFIREYQTKDRWQTGFWTPMTWQA